MRVLWTHEGAKRPREECLSISHIPSGGVIIDLFPVARFNFGSLVWLARPSLSAQGWKARKGRDGLAYIAISSHLAA